MADYLIVARSGRALAVSAKRAGYEVSVVDYFADEDTRFLSEAVYQLEYHCDSFFLNSLLTHIKDAISVNPEVKVVTGSGFESTPELLDNLGTLATVLSNTKETIINLKDPVKFFGILDKHSIPHPHVSFSKPKKTENFLIKNVAGIGGDHVKWCSQTDSKSDVAAYFQEFISGVVSSVVFLADGPEVSIVGFNQQLQSNEFTDMPFLYQGTININDTVEKRDVIEKIVKTISKETCLKGLCGLDYIIDESGDVFVLEVNPRPPASFELHETEQQSLFEGHLACFNDSLIDYQLHHNDNETFRGYVIFYAKDKLEIDDNINWPLWVKDRPSSGSEILPTFPVCSIHAQEDSIDKLKQVLFKRLERIESIITTRQNTIH